MLELVKILLERKLIRFRHEFCNAIEMPKQNLSKVEIGKQHFTVKHIMHACQKYAVNANWLFGIEGEDPFQNKSGTMPNGKLVITFALEKI